MEGSFPLKLVKDYPAVLAGKTLIVADLHIGIEREYWRAGIRASGLSRRVKEVLEELLEKTKPKHIVIAGDLKHNIPDFTAREAEEVQNIAELLASQAELTIIKGNHDGDLEKIIPWANIIPGSGILLGNAYILHGHANPTDTIFDAEVVVMGHIHPALAFKHRFGRILKKVFLLGKWRSIPTIVLPALSPLITGVDVSVPENMIGPLAKDLENLEALLPDGTYVGNTEMQKTYK